VTDSREEKVDLYYDLTTDNTAADELYTVSVRPGSEADFEAKLVFLEAAYPSLPVRDSVFRMLSRAPLRTHTHRVGTRRRTHSGLYHTALGSFRVYFDVREADRAVELVEVAPGIDVAGKDPSLDAEVALIQRFHATFEVNPSATRDEPANEDLL
jgi:hypothetical protein